MREDQNVEWKVSWRDEYLRWICGFANADGGRLLVGVNDKEQVVGLPNAKKLLEEIPNKVRDILGIMVDVNLRGTSPLEYIEIVVNPYPCPISYKGEYHFRSGSTKQELRGAALNAFLLRKQGLHWDSVPVPGAKVSDLDSGVLKKFRQRAIISKRLHPEIEAEKDTALIEKLHLNDGKYLKRAAVVLFHPDPERFVTGAFVKIGFFDTDLRYQDEIHGSLFDQVDGTMDILLTKYLKAQISYEGIPRVETYPIPREALREALLNAVAHKNYANGVPIQIRVYDDKLELWNDGELPQGWTVDTLVKNIRHRLSTPTYQTYFFVQGWSSLGGVGLRISSARVEMPEPKPPSFYMSME